MVSHFLLLSGFLSCGMNQPVETPVVLEIKKGKLQRLIPWQAYPADLPAPDTTYADCYALTPLADAHVHLALDGVDFAAARARWNDETGMHHMWQTNLESMARAGVLAARDGGDRQGWAHRLAAQMDSLFYIHTTHPAYCREGGYGTAFAHPLGRNAMPPWGELTTQIRANGSRHLKLMLSGIISFTEYGQVGPCQFTEKELSALVAQANGAGLPLMVHASGAEASALAASCGVHSLEHGYFLTESTLTQLAQKGIYWVPTLAPVAAQAPAYPVAARSLDRQMQMVELARQLGVPVVAGSDAGATGVRHGFGLLKELELLGQCGYSPLELLTKVLRHTWQSLNPDLDPVWPLPALNLYRQPPWQKLSALSADLITILWLGDDEIARTTLAKSHLKFSPASSD
ncbi:Imidazolonepropionase [Carboxydocella sporoproducens DSM 16521]|uniref:Imidazolonepropionase n=2 Tax=Carboxydocella TaxID=178898 RepID=A0A1T4MRI4_9FIRM|nr:MULTISPECIES: amidohydrolase family protein [Carboxydocella]AVX20365.1 Imidazolonepropionase [Carboxydocella thermautotrophica]SJZ69437.1 Imidazolonepropionase [Carboxydocella sporoproducens DSM 16521]